jgi:PAS domain S-box-containing protein
MGHRTSAVFAAVQKLFAVQKPAVTFLEENYRLVISGVLAIHLTWQGVVKAAPDWPLLPIACLYWIYTALVHLLLKRQIAYSLNPARYVRCSLDVGFAFVIIFLKGGDISSGFILLAIPAFLAVQRFEQLPAAFVLGIVLGGYVASSALRAAAYGEDLHFLQLASKTAVLAMIPSGARFVKMFLRQRLDQSTIKEIVQLREASLQTVARLVRGKMAVQACMIFEESDRGNYLLTTWAVAPRFDKDRPTANPQSSKQTLYLSTHMSARLGERQEKRRFRVSTGGASVLVDETGMAAPLPDELRLKPHGMRSLLIHEFSYPWSKHRLVVLLVNKLRHRISSPARPFIRDFTEEDAYLLDIALAGLRSRVLTDMLAIESSTFKAFLNTGVTEEVSRFGQDGRLSFANRAKLDFFGKKEDDVEARPFCWDFFHGRENACELNERVSFPEMPDLYELGPEKRNGHRTECPSCPSCAPFAVDWPLGKAREWHLLYDLAYHPTAKCRRIHVSHIRATRVTTTKGEPEVMETVYDSTAKYRSLVLTAFMAQLAEGHYRDMGPLAERVAELFGALLFRRIRLYEYRRNPQRFVCLAAHGHQHSMTDPIFEVPVEEQPDGQWDAVSAQWIRDGLDAPVLLRCEGRNPHLIPEANIPSYCKEYSVQSFPFSNRINSDKCSERLDVPLRFQGRLLGKLSIDNFLEKPQEGDARETHRFSAEDISIAWMAGRAVAYAWSRVQERLAFRQREAELEVMQTAAESLPLCMFVKNRDLRFEYVNQRFCDDVGKLRGAIVGRTDRDIFDVTYATKYQEDDRRVLASGETIVLVESHPVVPGGSKSVRVIKSPIRDASDSIVGVEGVYWYISELEMNTETIGFQHALLQSPNAVVYAHDVRGQITFVNPAASRLLGYSIQDLLGKNVRDILVPNQEEALAEAIQLAGLQRDGSAEQALHQFDVRTQTGRVLTLEIAVNTCEIAPGERGILVVGQDVTERNEVRRRLFEERQELLRVQEEALRQRRSEVDIARVLARGMSYSLLTRAGLLEGELFLLERQLQGQHPQQF